MPLPLFNQQVHTHPGSVANEDGLAMSCDTPLSELDIKDATTMIRKSGRLFGDKGFFLQVRGGGNSLRDVQSFMHPTTAFRSIVRYPLLEKILFRVRGGRSNLFNFTDMVLLSSRMQ
jgi:hypothetical protein